MKTAKKGDMWLILGVAAAAAVLFVLLWWLPKTGSAVEVTVDGKPFITLPLWEPTAVDIPAADGSCTLVIADGQATVTAATCPDHICVRHRPISRTGESIVCLPNRVVVTVVGGAPAVDGEV